MSAALLAGWALAALALSLAAAMRARVLAREELVARACHELRTPLTAARLALHALARDADSRAALVAAAVERELQRADLALADLCAAREGARAPDRVELVDVSDVLAETGAAWDPVARREGREVQVDAPPIASVRADRLRLAQALGNLVGNALEHGAGPVRLRARPTAAGRVRFEVDDAGPGLPAAVADIAARPRAGRGRRGRGLAIAADIAARHGGRLGAAPTPAGARLTLELPGASDPGRRP